MYLFLVRKVCIGGRRKKRKSSRGCVLVKSSEGKVKAFQFEARWSGAREVLSAKAFIAGPWWSNYKGEVAGTYWG